MRWGGGGLVVWGDDGGLVDDFEEVPRSLAGVEEPRTATEANTNRISNSRSTYSK